MKTKSNIIVFLTILILIIALLTTGVIADVSDLGELNGTGKSKIGQVFTLSYSESLQGNTGLYCIQKGKSFSGETSFILKNYVEINGKEATVYSSATDESPRVVNSNLNAEVAYILNLDQGYGTHSNPTAAQQALWAITNSWTKEIFGDTTYNWDGNKSAAKNNINTLAEQYANGVGDQKATTDSSSSTNKTETLKVKDKTNKDDISKIDVGEYYRIGPFKWQFEGILQNIVVMSNKGEVPDSSVRFVKYEGKKAKTVEVSKILTGEAFYVDVKKGEGISQIKELKLNTMTAPTGDSSQVYTAKIWFFHSSSSQNVIYVESDHSGVKPSKGDGKGDYDIPFASKIGIVKVDDRDETIPLEKVGFKFKATVYRNVKVGSHYEYVDNDGDGNKETQVSVDDYEWKWVLRYLGSDLDWSAETLDAAAVFYTNETGRIDLDGVSGETVAENTLKAIEVENPYYGYNVGKEYSLGSVYENKKLTNHQYKVKLSGYVWLEGHDGKTTVTSEVHDSGEKGFNGIKVYLKDKGGNTVKSTTTSELGLYSEIQGGEYQFVDVDLDKLQAGQYHVEFEYCGIRYQSVKAVLDRQNGSKAIDTETRKVLDGKFTSVDSTGGQSLNVNGVTVNYNGVSDHKSTYDSCTGCEVFAKTNEAGYDLYSDFIPSSEEIRYVNLGLFKKAQVDYALSQDLYNVKIDVNGKSHIYKYATVRYSNNGNDINEDSSWNMGVKFQNNKGTYNRAIYKADAEYEAPNHKDNEIRIYVTYKIALKNESAYVGRINNIVDYYDNRYEIVNVGNSINEGTNEINDLLNVSSKGSYNDEYSKCVIDVNSTLNAGETKYLYVQFKMEREAILTIMNNGELLNNVAEINSYTTFKIDDLSKTVAVIDQDSVPGNAKPGQIDTYEDDTDAARSLQLELKNARAIVGTVFVDSTGKGEEVVTGEERKGNGIFENGEKTVSGVKVTLHEVGKDDSSYDNERKTYTTETNEKGEFEIKGYIPGNYVLTYRWGNETYKVQYYKGTIYDENRKQSDSYWYRGSEYGNDTISVNERKTDALDSKKIREEIDNEMEALKYNTLENEINKAYNGGSDYIKTTKMDSSTPEMSFSVEYETTITDGTVDQVKFTVSNVDFGIVERPKQKLEFSKRVSGFKITLANGQILVDAEVTEDGKLKGSHDHTTYMEPTVTNGITINDGIIRTEMDNELIEGATLETTYTMKVTNIGELDYLSDKYYYYGNKKGSEKVKVSVTEFLDYVDGRLSVLDDKWTETDKDYLNKVNASQKDNEEYLNSTRTYLTSHLSKELAPKESNTVTLHTSKLLTSTDDNTFNNKSEITEVTKNDGFNTGTPVKVEWNQDKFHFNIDNSETAIIIPSTGEDKSYNIYIIIGITSLLVLGIGVFVIRKFIINNK